MAYSGSRLCHGAGCRRAAAVGDDRAPAPDRRRDDRRQQGRRLSGDECPVQFPDPADVRGDPAAGAARPPRQCRARPSPEEALPDSFRPVRLRL